MLFMMNPRLLIEDQRGGVAVILALGAMVLFGVVGLAIDSAQVYAARSAIKGAADAAALAAVSSNAQDLSKKERRKLAKMYFHANCEQKCGDIERLRVRFKDNGTTVKIIAESTLPTALGRTLGLKTMHADVESEASMNLGYAEVYLALDNSESMNIPNTEDDVQLFIDLLDEDLGANTWAGKGCTFACHGKSETASGDRSYYEFARDNGIVLRQDFVRQSATSLLDILAENESAAQFSVGVMSFDYQVTMRQEATDDLDQVKAALEALTGASEYTDIHRSMTDIKNLVGEGGDGSADYPAKILVLVTDGVHNKWETEHGTINAADCETIKDAGGVQIVVLHVIYPDLEKYFPGLGVNQKVVPYTDDRFDQLEACATPELYFEANHGDDIVLAFQEIADAIVRRTPRLVQ